MGVVLVELTGLHEAKGFAATCWKDWKTALFGGGAGAGPQYEISLGNSSAMLIS